MASRNEGLFIKVSIQNIKEGEVARIGLQKFGLLVVLGSFANDKGECFPSQSSLAELCGVGRSRINAMIKELCEYRTEDGEVILLKTTKRKALNKTTTEYKFSSASGIAFGKKKIVPKTIQRHESTGDVTKSNEVVIETVQGLYQNRDRGCIEKDTLTKAIEIEPINKNHIEPERESASHEKKEISGKTNKDNTIVEIDNEKDSTPIEKSTNIVESLQEINFWKSRKRISHSIVNNGRNKKRNVEECTRGTHTVQTEQQSFHTATKGMSTYYSSSEAQKGIQATSRGSDLDTMNTSEVAKLSRRDIVVLRAEQSRKTNEREREELLVREKAKAAEMSKAIRMKRCRMTQDSVQGDLRRSTDGRVGSSVVSKSLETTPVQREEDVDFLRMIAELEL